MIGMLNVRGPKPISRNRVVRQSPFRRWNRRCSSHWPSKPMASTNAYGRAGRSLGPSTEHRTAFPRLWWPSWQRFSCPVCAWPAFFWECCLVCKGFVSFPRLEVFPFPRFNPLQQTGARGMGRLLRDLEHRHDREGRELRADLQPHGLFQHRLRHLAWQRIGSPSLSVIGKAPRRKRPIVMPQNRGVSDETSCHSMQPPATTDAQRLSSPQSPQPSCSGFDDQ